MFKRIPAWVTGAFLLALGMIVIYASGCKEGSNTAPLSMTLSGSGLGTLTDTMTQYSGSYMLSGYVKNNNDPVVNMPVELLVGDSPVTSSVLTTGEGQFIFQGLAPALYSVRVGHGSATFTEVIYPVYIRTGGTQSPADLTIPIEKSNPDTADIPGNIEAYVVDSTTNQPIVLATVNLYKYNPTTGSWGNPLTQLFTNGNGYVIFEKDANKYKTGLYRLDITKESYKSLSYPVNIQKDGSMTPKSPRINVEKISEAETIVGSIVGIVHLDISQEPLPEITITLKKNGAEVTGSPRKTTSEGKFAFDGLGEGEYTITASGPGYTPVTRTCYIRKDGSSDPLNNDLIVTRTNANEMISVTGRVLDSFTHAPLEFVSCTLVGYGSVISDSKGQFTFTIPNASAGYTINFVKMGYVSTSAKLTYSSAQKFEPYESYILYTQETGKGAIAGRFVRDLKDYPDEADFRNDLASAVVRIYQLIPVTKPYKDNDIATAPILYETYLCLTSSNPEPIKSANIVINTDNPPYIYGTFKISHLDPTTNNSPYLVFIGSNSAELKTVTRGSGHFYDGIENKFVVWNNTADGCVHGWTNVSVQSDTTTYLTNFEDNR
ncbi:MAG TPA: carboxypeptidase regulatory-like domain-containing protein [Candidatus Ozemobacteraceae bacterium]